MIVLPVLGATLVLPIASRMDATVEVVVAIPKLFFEAVPLLGPFEII